MDKDWLELFAPADKITVTDEETGEVRDITAEVKALIEKESEQE